jgi:hypothetical protein
MAVVCKEKTGFSDFFSFSHINIINPPPQQACCGESILFIITLSFQSYCTYNTTPSPPPHNKDKNPLSGGQKASHGLALSEKKKNTLPSSSGSGWLTHSGRL